ALDRMRVVIVGGVAAGASCATRCRRLSEKAKITMVERGEFVSFANCGLPYFVGDVIHDEDALLVAKPQLFREQFGVDVRTKTEALRVDASAKQVIVKDAAGEESALEYDALVLATGAKPIRPPLPGIDDFANIFAVRDIPDARHIRTVLDAAKKRRGSDAVPRAVVVGAGFVGLEMIENLHGLGCEVALVEALPQVLGPLDREMSAPIKRLLSEKGIQLHLGEAVAGFEAGTEVGEVMVTTGAGSRIPADLVILGIGVKPELSLAKSAGCEVGERGGIKVDEHMRTSVPDVYAAGDGVETRHVVTGQQVLMPLAGPANRQGRIAADCIFGAQPDVFRGVQGTAVCGVMGTTAAMTGANARLLEQAGIPFQHVTVHPKNHAGYYPGAQEIHLKLLFAPDSGKVLGAQAVGAGEGVEKRIDVISTAIQGGLTVFDLEESELCYSPQFGSAKDPVNFAGMTAANVVHGLVTITDWPDALKATASGEAVLVDVREPEEFAQGSAPGAINVPLSQLRERIAELPKYKRIDIFCLTGIRAYISARALTQSGFTNVANVTGGWVSFLDFEESQAGVAT
ncbi:Coenzyme A disulfide reductase (CoA-disulfide reductase) (CoADR), partial [Durusdinium trenchii]